MSDDADPIRAGRRLWVGIPAPTIDSETRDLLEEIEPGGVILFRRNINSLDQVKELTSGLREICGDSLHVCIDQEGGRVVRFPDGLTFFPGNMCLGSMALSDPEKASELAWEQGWHTGLELAELGIDVNLAPCVDLVSCADSRGIGSRSFGSNPQIAISLATSIGQGMRAAGVSDCWKHYPGLGRVTIDPHFGLPATDAEGMSQDLEPFGSAASAGAAMVMTSHVIAMGLDSKNPVTTSAAAVGELRSGLDFSGVVMTDCLEMGGVSELSPGDLAEKSLRAGHDVLLVSHTPELQRQIHRRLTDLLSQEDDDHRESLLRLDQLSRGSVSEREPSSRSGREVALEICRGGVSLLRGELPSLPLAGSWHLVLPQNFSHSPVEDPRPATELELLQEEVPALQSVQKFDTAQDLQKLAVDWQSQTEKSQIVVAIQGARLQADLQEALSLCEASSVFMIVLLLEDPRDLESLPTGDSVAVLCAHGARPLHLRTLAEVLRGETIPRGGQPI